MARPVTDQHASVMVYLCVLQMIYHVLVFAFLIVIASTALMTPILLYVFNLRNSGWMWQHAALFSAMIAPTDAVSVSSILKKGMPKMSASSTASHGCNSYHTTLTLLYYGYYGSSSEEPRTTAVGICVCKQS